MLRSTTLVGLVALFSSVAAFDVQARIKCNGPYQVVRGHGELVTPYCQDEYLARVARSYGVRVAASEIRRSTSRKERICQFIGHDTRIYDICLPYRPESCERRFC